MTEQSEVPHPPNDRAGESVTGLRVAVRMLRNDDAPIQDIELLADELVDSDAARSAVFSTAAAIALPSIPPLPPLAALHSSVPPPRPARRAEPDDAVQLCADVERLPGRQHERDTYLSELERMFARRTQELFEADQREASMVARLHRHSLRISELEQQLADKVAMIELLQAELAQRERSNPDDLLRIRGVGPSFAVALRRIGVDSLAMIAGWKAPDVALVAEQLGIKPTRIERDRWVEQANALLEPQTDEPV